MIVIFDIDDVLMPWAEQVHLLCMEAGLNPDQKPWTQWSMWEDYGCTKDQWLEVVNAQVKEGGLYHSQPYPGAVEAVQRVADADHEVHLVTARGFHAHPELIRQWTKDWIQTFNVPGELWFAHKKSEIAAIVGASHGIDDRYENWVDLWEAGVDVFLKNQPHNAASPVPAPYRVDTVTEFVEKILA